MICRSAPVLGREPELGALTEAFVQVRRGAGIVLVAGEAGSGKTRLIEEFETRTDDARFAWGGCVDAADNMAYAPWSELLGTLVRELDDEIVGTARTELSRLVFGLGTGESDAVASDGKALLFDATVELLTRAATRPLVYVIEDIHWLDAASRDLLLAVLRRLRRQPILVIATYRPEECDASARELLAQLGRGATRVTLGPIPDESARSIVSALAGEHDATAVDAIIERAAGNPLFLEELATSRDATLPDSLRDLLLAHFDALPDEAKRLARTAAIIGQRSPRAWLVAASGLSPERARHAARAATDGGVLIADGERKGYAFRHGLLREAIVDDLLPDEQVALHRAVAAALETHPELGVDLDRSAELAQHWDLAEQPMPALLWSVRAAEHAVACYAVESAIAFYERALRWRDAVDDGGEIPPRDELLLDAADAAGDAGRLERAAELVHTALREATQRSATSLVTAAARCQRHFWAAGRGEEFLQYGEAALAQLDHVDAATCARFLNAYTAYLLEDGRAEAALDLAPRLLGAVEAVEDDLLQANAYQIVAQCYEGVNDAERMLRASDRAIEISRKRELHGMRALALYNRAAMLQTSGDNAALFSVLDELDDVMSQHGLRRLLVPSATLRASELCHSGSLAAAVAALDRVRDIAIEGAELQEFRWAYAVQALRAGDLDNACGVLDDALQTAAADVNRFTMISQLYAESLAWRGELHEARELIADAADALKGRRDPFLNGLVASTAIRIEAELAERENDDAAKDAWERAKEYGVAWRETFAHLDTPFPLTRAFDCAVNAEWARLDRAEDAAIAAEIAANAFAELGRPFDETYFRWRHACAALAGDDRTVATSLLSRARATALELGAAHLLEAITHTARTAQLRLGAGKTSVDGMAALSARELDVLALLAGGRSNPEIADELVISRHTVRAHVSNILEKLNASSRAEAVGVAHQRGIL